MKPSYCVSYITGASSRDWLIVGQGLLSLQQVRVEGNVFFSSISSLSFIFSFSPVPLLLFFLVEKSVLSGAMLSDCTDMYTLTIYSTFC